MVKEGETLSRNTRVMSKQASSDAERWTCGEATATPPQGQKDRHVDPTWKIKRHGPQMAYTMHKE